MSNELIDFVIVSVALLAIGIYGLSVKRNAIRMLFAVEIVINAANLNLDSIVKSPQGVIDMVKELEAQKEIDAQAKGMNLNFSSNSILECS